MAGTAGDHGLTIWARVWGVRGFMFARTAVTRVSA
jgi:hypothetical protein